MSVSSAPRRSQPYEPVAVVPRVVPRIGAVRARLEVAFVVVGVRELPVVLQAVVVADVERGGRPVVDAVAGRVIGVALIRLEAMGGARELVGLIELEVRRLRAAQPREVQIRQPPGQIIVKRKTADLRAGSVLMHDAGQAAGGIDRLVVDVVRRDDDRRTG